VKAEGAIRVTTTRASGRSSRTSTWSTRLVEGNYVVAQEPKPQMPGELARLFEEEVH